MTVAAPELPIGLRLLFAIGQYVEVQKLREMTIGVAVLGGALVALLLGPFGLLVFGVSAVSAEVRYWKRLVRR
jgi:hypothetical protein